MKYPSVTGTFSGPFFGFPCEVTVFRKSVVSCNFAEITFWFPEGYQPNGCQMFRVKEAIDKLFHTTSSIKPDDGVNKKVIFGWVSPYANNMSNQVATGMALVIFTLVRENLCL